MGKKSILIIDDFEPLLEEIAEFLQFEGFTTYTAQDGAEGVQKAIQYIPNLIICDIEMPVLNGYEVLKSLEQIPTTATIPFIFLTARAQAQDYRKGLSLGVDDYITKPINLDDLILTISKRLEKNEKLKQFHENKFIALIKNPTIGFYIYQEDNFILINKKISDITGYTKNEINKRDLKEIILGKSENIINDLCMSYKGIHENFQKEISVLTKEKQVKFLEVFGNHVVIDGKKTLIGSINEKIIEKEKESGKIKKNENEIDLIIDYLKNFSKENIVDEILNIRKLIDFEENGIIKEKEEEINLTKREIEILKLICKGLTNNEIGEKLFISSRTVDNHRANLLSKTQTKNTAHLIAFVLSNNLISL
ncbi:MAG: response regulator [Bacteroidales bacterium]|nr:response regulator [Bacteroidales bacterium]MBN2757729.1 response regulator [Bacteroidales bacterium]